MRKFCLIALVFVNVALTAQVLLPTPETAFESMHHFNPEVIKGRGIKKITFEIVDKKDFEMVVDKSLTETYEFNTDGYLSRHYYTTITKTIEKQISKVNQRGQRVSYSVNEYVYDTISTSYFYAGDKLILRRYHDGLNYYESRYFRYDSLGNLTKELRYKETNVGPDRSTFILGNQVLLSEDSFQYHRYSPKQMRCVFLNNENRSYKERIINYDSLGRKTSENENYTVASWIMQENKYEYTGNRLSSATFEGNTNNKLVLKNTYEYDENNELYTEMQYKNDVLLKEISYVTNKADTLLGSFVVRDHINKSMRIVKLKYDCGMIGCSR